MSAETVAFFGFKGDPYTEMAHDHLRSHFTDVQAFLSTRSVPPNSPYPGLLNTDWLFCFKTKTIFGALTLESVRLGCLNFHTAAPRYPGSGGVNWALYNDDPTASITVHELTETIDAGPILRVDEFDWSGADTVADLLRITHERHLETFKSVTSAIATDGIAWLDNARAHAPDVSWADKTYRIQDLEKLKRITPELSAEEVARRVKATFYRHYRPYIELYGYRFELVSDLADTHEHSTPSMPTSDAENH